MARRMFTEQITDSDAFLDMPSSSQCLYFQLNMKADDDGFVNNPKKIVRSINVSEDDLKLLIMKRFVIGFESGIVVIKHWRMHNYLRKDRYIATVYQEELDMLDIKDNGSYTLKKEEDNILATKWQPNGNHLSPQVRLGKVSIGKDKKDIGVFEVYCVDDLQLLNTLNDFEKMRKAINKPMTKRSKEMLVKKLDEQKEDKIQVLEQSIEKCWSTIYPIAKNNQLNRVEPIPTYVSNSKPMTSNEIELLKKKMKEIGKK